MRKFICALAILTPLFCHCENRVCRGSSSVTNLLCEADLKSYFKQVHISSSNVVLRFHYQGMRYKFTINDSEPKISGYGESICLSTNQSIRIVNRGLSLELKGFSNEEEAGFAATSRIDLRSLGGDLRVKRARWIICSRKLEIDNDIGLFVVPLPGDCTRKAGCANTGADLQGGGVIEEGGCDSPCE